MMFWDQRRCFHEAMPYTGKRRIRSLRLKGDETDPYDRAIPDPTDPDGTRAVREQVEWLQRTKPGKNSMVNLGSFLGPLLVFASSLDSPPHHVTDFTPGGAAP